MLLLFSHEIYRRYNHGGWHSGQTTSGEGPYLGHKPGSSAYKEYVRQGVIPTGKTTFNTYTGKYESEGAGASSIDREVYRRYTQGGRF